MVGINLFRARHIVQRHTVRAGRRNRHVLPCLDVSGVGFGLYEHRVLAYLKPRRNPRAERTSQADPRRTIDLPPRIAVVREVGVGAPGLGDAERAFLELAVCHQLFSREEAHVVVCGGLVGGGRAEELQAIGAGGEHGDGTGIGDERIGSGGEGVQQIVLRNVRLVSADFPEVDLRRLAETFGTPGVVERQRVEAGGRDRHVLIRKAVDAGVGLDEHRVCADVTAFRHPCSACRVEPALGVHRPAGIGMARPSRIVGIGAGRSRIEETVFEQVVDLAHAHVVERRGTIDRGRSRETQPVGSGRLHVDRAMVRGQRSVSGGGKGREHVLGRDLAVHHLRERHGDRLLVIALTPRHPLEGYPVNARGRHGHVLIEGRGGTAVRLEAYRVRADGQAARDVNAVGLGLYAVRERPAGNVGAAAGETFLIIAVAVGFLVGHKISRLEVAVRDKLVARPRIIGRKTDTRGGESCQYANDGRDRRGPP